MKVFIRGERQLRDQLPQPYISNKDDDTITIGPTCRNCLLAVLDTRDIIHCLRYHVDIGKSNDPVLKEKVIRVMERNKCNPGIFINQEDKNVRFPTYR